MFSAKTYTARRHELRTKIGSGIILLPGNSLSPNNYPNNAYYFRQDSSFRYYFGLNVPSVVGVIDADYRGECTVALHNDTDAPRTVAPGDRIAQLMVVPVVRPVLVQAEELDETDRGAGGFGSTGR